MPRGDKPDPTPTAHYKIGIEVVRDNVASFPGLFTAYNPVSEFEPTSWDPFITALGPFCSGSTTATRWWWEPVVGGPKLFYPLTTTLNGSAYSSEILSLSDSATIRIGGIGIDITGTYRNVRSWMQIPTGVLMAAYRGQGKKVRDALHYPVSSLYTAFSNLLPVDRFGRSLSLYNYLSFDVNSLYERDLQKL